MSFLRHEVLFDVPVYRLTEDERLRETQRLAAQDVRYQLNPDRDGTWAFNEVIAWVSVWQDGTAIKYDAYERDLQIYRRNFDGTRPLHPAGRLSEVHFLSSRTSDEIWTDICESLEVVRNSYPSRFVDTRQVDRWGPHVNWRAVLGFAALT